ncbi:type IV secretion system coupling TraD/TrwB family protein [Prosthecobacter fusiformis]|uniref:Type IV secretion system coupling TraD/TrwB family protein n=1 Tax=Prosthecobacter fusiformis TaxID=48464 RepID=A0A4R7SPG3_9BACT|nr:type IV secretion system DNA-binding domain-containing protein [Prosthecobacter fusiformis]TDU80804.1 type IV secretion system coupling TraD/TrwB family protein [Prosthecobacter fusiformis]
MTTLEQELTGQFYRFELPGRGGQVCPEPVSIEPPFRSFPGYHLPQPKVKDDGRKHTFFSGFMERLGRTISDTEEPADPEEHESPQFFPWERQAIVEFQISLPRERKGLAARMEQLLSSISLCGEPVSFEILGMGGDALLQIAASIDDAPLVERQLSLLFPGMVVTATEDALMEAWQQTGNSFAICECGLEREFMLPLGLIRSGPYFPLLSALASLDETELGILQVIFEPVRHSWGGEALQAVSDGEGGPFFVNRPELLTGAKAKFSRPLHAVVVRFASSADDSERAWKIVAEMLSGFVADASDADNRLIPLSNDGYEGRDHERDLILRQSRRTGMLLNRDELSWLVRFPEDPLTAALLRSDSGMTRAAPESAIQTSPLQLGFNEHGGVSNPVFLSDENRFRHTHVIGASGTGKSTLLFNLIRQDIEAGAGVGVLDPHGDLIEKILGIIPDHRIKDVILLDPSDEEYVIGFNILSAHSDLEKTLLASDLVSIFARLSTSWGDQMNSVFQNAILAFLESRTGGTLADLRRFLLDKDFRSAFLKTVEDPEAVFYWEKAFPQLGGNKSIGPILTRLESFLSPKSIRYMVSEKSNNLDFAQIMNSGKILLACLPQGRMGRENSYLLGSLLVAKFQQTAMSRQALAEKDRKPFWLYIDEFQNFATPSMSEILSGARKYRLGLTLAHQDLAQIRRYPELSSAVLTNTCTRIVFRPGDEDAQSLAAGFAHFDSKALMSLSVGDAVCRIGRSDADFNLRVPASDLGDKEHLGERRLEVIESSRSQYGRSKVEIAAERVENSTAPHKPSLAAERQEKKSIDPEPRKTDAGESAEEKPKAPSLSSAVPSSPASPSSYSPTTIREDVEALGRGGALHQAVQLELKQIAETHGFRAVVEKQISGSLETVDLYLERGSTIIACEISVTNTLEYELKNVTKCLKAGFPLVAMVALDAGKLAKLEAAIRNSLSDVQTTQVQFFLKSDFVTLLQSLVLKDVHFSGGKEKLRKGWKVNTTTVEISEEEAKARAASIASAMADSLKSRKRSNGS